MNLKKHLWRVQLAEAQNARDNKIRQVGCVQSQKKSTRGQHNRPGGGSVRFTEQWSRSPTRGGSSVSLSKQRKRPPQYSGPSRSMKVKQGRGGTPTFKDFQVCHLDDSPQALKEGTTGPFWLHEDADGIPCPQQQFPLHPDSVWQVCTVFLFSTSAGTLNNLGRYKRLLLLPLLHTDAQGLSDLPKSHSPWDNTALDPAMWLWPSALVTNSWTFPLKLQQSNQQHSSHGILITSVSRAFVARWICKPASAGQTST